MKRSHALKKKKKSPQKLSDWIFESTVEKVAINLSQFKRISRSSINNQDDDDDDNDYKLSDFVLQIKTSSVVSSTFINETTTGISFEIYLPFNFETTSLISKKNLVCYWFSILKLFLDIDINDSTCQSYVDWG